MKTIADIIHHEKEEMSSKHKSKKSKVTQSEFHSFGGMWEHYTGSHFIRGAADEGFRPQKGKVKTYGEVQTGKIIKATFEFDHVPSDLKIGEIVYAYCTVLNKWFLSKVLDIREPSAKHRVKVEAPGFNMKKHNPGAYPNSNEIFYSCSVYRDPTPILDCEIVRENFT